MRGQVAEQDRRSSPWDNRGCPPGCSMQPFEGRVRLLGAVIDPLTRLGDIRISVKPNPALRPGAFARGSVQVSKADRTILPQTAVLSDNQGSVRVPGGCGQPRRTARCAGGRHYVCRHHHHKGLNGDERIVTTAAGFLREAKRST